MHILDEAFSALILALRKNNRSICADLTGVSPFVYF